MKIVFDRQHTVIYLLSIVLTASFLYYQVGDLLIPINMIWAFLVFLYIGKEKISHPVSKIIGILFVYIFILLVFSFFKLSFFQEAKVGLNVLSIACLIYASITSGYYLALTDKRESLLEVTALLGLINSIANIYSWITTTGGVLGRYNFSSIINHSVSANVGLSVIAAVLFLGREKNNVYKWAGFFLCASNIVIIMTRKKQVEFLVAVLLYIYFSIRKEYNLSKRVGRMLFVVVSGLLAYVCLYEQIRYILGYYSNMFDSNRVDMIQRVLARQDSVSMLKTSHYFGVGYGNYAFFSSSTTLGSAHNGMFSILAELGIPGLILVLILLGIIVIMSFKILKKNTFKPINSVAVLLVITSMMFFTANFTLLPPVNERSYYLECIIYWGFVGTLIATRKPKLFEEEVVNE